MTVERPRAIERASALWEWESSVGDDGREGPIALLKQAGGIAWSHKFRLSASLVAGLVVGGLYAHSLPRIYNAHATLLLEPRQFSQNMGGLQQSLDLNSAESELQIILSERLLSQVFESLLLINDPELSVEPSGTMRELLSDASDLVLPFVNDLLGGPKDSSVTKQDDKWQFSRSAEEQLRRRAFANFTDKVSARRVGQSYVVEIGYSSSDPNLPARVANAILSGYILQSVLAKEQLARAGTETLQGRLDALAAQVTAARDAMKAGTLPLVATPDADAKITGAALPPLAPSSPRPTLITVFGGMLGLFGSLAVLAARTTFNRKVYSARDLVRQTNLPCLATIPDPGDKLGRLIDVNRPAHKRYAAAVRDLRTAIDNTYPRKLGERHAVIALVAHSTNADSFVLSLSLAEILKKGGRDVTLLRSTAPADPHGPASRSLADAALRNLAPGMVQYDAYEGIALLSIRSDDQRTNTFADFRSQSVSSIIEACRKKGDVVIELPPLATSMDAVSLAAYADVVVMVVRAGRTTTDEVRQTEQSLRRAGTKLMGYAITRAKT
jgi:capsular polysaccharide biosynthesis protein